MPNFTSNEPGFPGIYIPSTRLVFRRGHRLDDMTCRRLRDLCIAQLDGLGCDPEDVSHIMSMPLCPRQVRNRRRMVTRQDDIRVSMAKVLITAKREISEEAKQANC
jgi:hypothetical protein